jgi:hypothetical protein
MNVRSEVLVRVNIKVTEFGDVAPCSALDR